MRQTRWTVLECIRRQGRATVADIAAETGIPPITARHHLYSLVADGLITQTVIRQGVGRPQHGYSLTEAGRQQFPTGYHVLVDHLLEALKQTRPDAAVRQLLEDVARRLRAQNVPFLLENGAEGEIRAVIECPYAYDSQHHPEICRIDEVLIGEALKLPVSRAGCLLEGNKTCTFNIKLSDSASAG